MLKNRKIQLLILIVLLIIVTTFFIIKNVIYKSKAKNSKEQYNNIKLENGIYGGPSKTRNIGINIATGKYIMFVDSDDYLKNNYISRMMENIESYNLKVCSYYFEYLDVNKIKPQKYDEKKTENEIIEITKDDFITLYGRQLLNLVWNKIYYANIIKENNILL